MGFEPARGRVIGLALLTFCGVSLLGDRCGGDPPPLDPAPGLPQYQEGSVVPVPGGVLNAVGESLLIRRTDLSIDTWLGTFEIGATYNSASAAWRWTFDASYDGQTFVDSTGASYDTTALAPGDAIPGTVWIVRDADTIESKGGLVHEFDARGRLAAVHWRGAGHPQLQHESTELAAGVWRTTAIRQCLEPGTCTDVFTISYDTAQRVDSIVDRAGRSTSFHYDAAGRLEQAQDAFDLAQAPQLPGFRYSYDAAGRLIRVANSEGEGALYTYVGTFLVEACALLWSDPECPAGNPIHSFLYKAVPSGAFETHYTDPLGYKRIFRYDASRRVSGLRQQVGLFPSIFDESAFLWDGFRVSQETDPAGVVLSRTYVNDDVITESRPGGNVLTWEYEPAGENREAPFATPVRRITDSFGVAGSLPPVEERTYDLPGTGRLLSVANGAAETTVFSYGPHGEIETVTLPNGVMETRSQYGDHGHPAQIDTARATATNSYDAVGNLVSGSDASSESSPGLGGIVARSFDADRNVTSVELAPSEEGAPTQFVTILHRSDGQRTEIQRPYGGDTIFLYDDFGRPRERREKASAVPDGVGGFHADWQSTLFEYDALGRTTAVERANGMRTERTYDGAGRVRSVTHCWVNGSGCDVETTAAFTYEEGRLVSLVDSAHGGSAETYGYDAAGRSDHIVHPGGEELDLDYDERNRVISEEFTFAGSPLRALVYDYDGADRQTRIEDGGVAVIVRVYVGGELAEVQYGNGLTRTFEYDHEPEDTLQLRKIHVETSQSQPGDVESTDVVWLSWTPTVWSSSVFDGSTQTDEEYDLGPTSGSGALPGLRLYDELVPSAYTYDELSNDTRERLELPDYDTFIFFENVYNPERNRLLEERRSEYEATPEGSMLIGQEATHSYEYDAAGFMTARDGVPLAWTASGRIAQVGGQTSFSWDARNRLVSRIRDVGGSAVQSDFLFGGRVESILGVPTTIDLGVVRIRLDVAERRYRHHDFRGNVKFVTDDAGAIVVHYEYSGYGVSAIHGSAEDEVRFAGRLQVEDLFLLGSRLYDPLKQRFVSPDPIHQLINQYSYTLGNPIRFWDPSGQDFEDQFGNPGNQDGGDATNPDVVSEFDPTNDLRVLVARVNFYALLGLAAAAQHVVPFTFAIPAFEFPTCAPTGVTGAAPSVTWLLAVLVPVQIALGIVVLRGARRRGRGRQTDERR